MLPGHCCDPVSGSWLLLPEHAGLCTGMGRTCAMVSADETASALLLVPADVLSRLLPGVEAPPTRAYSCSARSSRPASLMALMSAA